MDYKNIALSTAIDSYKVYHYRVFECDKLILNELKSQPQTINSLAKKLNRVHETIRTKLNRLYEKRLVERNEKQPQVWRLV